MADTPASPATASQQQNKQVSSAIASLNRVRLGDYAVMEIPTGYRFAGGDAARIWLDRLGNPVSSGMLGVLAPESGKWWAVVDFNDIGYVKSIDEQADFGAILKAVQKQNDSENAQQTEQGPARITAISWEIEPKYDADAHCLEWAFRAEGQSGKVINEKVALFGRRGVLTITAVRPARADSIPLKELVKGITFNEGQRYTDYQDGDKVASAGLKELVMGDDSSASHQDDLPAARSVPNSMILIYSGVGGCVVLATGLLVYGKFKKRKARPAYANGHAVAAHNGNGNGKNGTLSRQGSARQRKMFNYQKFYSDLVLELSGHTYSWVSPANGHSHPRAAEPAAPQIPVPSAQSPAIANAELIACQKSLIEEQRNLMREQTRIIEEKAKLIAEYNQLMEKWSDEQFSLKLD